MIVIHFKKSKKLTNLLYLLLRFRNYFLVGCLEIFLVNSWRISLLSSTLSRMPLLVIFQLRWLTAMLETHGANPHFPSVALGWMIQEGMGLLHSSGPCFGTFFDHVTSKHGRKKSFVHLFVVCSRNSFSPHLKCLESMILLIFYLSLTNVDSI
jgi:hypothetical protein